MYQNINELQKQIVQKNLALNILKQCSKPDRGKIQKIEIELDILLYRYYKAMRNCNGILVS